jgi:tRNA 5-methylaminomethyl-2-thiouridine biosynthesis bifunctional protein
VSWGPLQPARIDFSDAGAPAAPDFNDLYHTRAGALAQAQHVFLGGNGLPARWAGRPRFVILETGFGLGNNFLATRAAWQQDPQRCDRLWYLAIDKHPPRRDDLARAHAGSALPALADELVERWPPLTPDLHLIDFDGGRVRLLLALGDIAKVLPELIATVDAFYLDGFAPDRNPAMWDPWRLRQLARLAANGATLATWSVAGAVRQGLAAAGFEVAKAPGFGGKREMTVGRFRPRAPANVPPGRQAPDAVRQVAVVGAGLAGAAVAQALAARGLAVQVFERHAGCARETSGNAGGLFHGVLHAHDGPHARWLRAAALHTERVLRPLVARGTVTGAVAGLLRGEQRLPAEAMRALLQDLALPPDYLQVHQPSRLAQGQAAWFYPGGGWVAPATLCAQALSSPGVETHYGNAVQQLRPAGDRWQLIDPAGATLGSAEAVLLCNADDAARLLAPRSTGTPWPLRRVRGQTTLLPAALPGLPTLPLPLADTGYALQLADGRLLCGATSQPDDDEPGLRDADHRHNLATLQRLTGWAGPPPADALNAQLDGRVGWRLQSDDRLPLLGPVPDGDGAAGTRRWDQPRFVPRQAGLYVFTALGSRGITQATLAAEALASWLTGDPMPLPASLLDALDVARFVARAVRRAAPPSIE